WLFDPHSGRFEMAGPAPIGLDTLVTTRHGVMGVDVDWPDRDDDAGYNRPWNPDGPVEHKGMFVLDAAKKSWRRLDDGKQAAPQTWYDLTSRPCDAQGDQVL